MNRLVRNCMALMIAGALCCATACSKEPSVTYNARSAVKDTGSKPIADRTGTDLVKDMRIGWNLGNTLDATGTSGLNSENSWGMPTTTKAMISALAQSGIKTLRVPVSWHRHFIDKSYTIDPQWMARVKQIVDWAIEEDMYVILNVHHDNADNANVAYADGFYPAQAAKEESEKFLVNVWSQIALAFNGGYDEHLIFEIMNEPRLIGTQYEWWFNPNDSDCVQAAQLIREYEELSIRAIRASGKNNARRCIMVPAYSASPDSALDSNFRLPADSAKDRLIVSVHAYSPYTFAMDENGDKKFQGKHERELDTMFYRLYGTFVDKGIPVVIDETGATNKNNLAEREKWFAYFFGKAASYGMPCCMWDNQIWEIQGTSYSEHFGYFDRTKCEWHFPTLLKKALDALPW